MIVRLPVPRITIVFSFGKCPSFDRACAWLLKIATLCDPFGSNVWVGPELAGPTSSLAKKIGRSKPTRRVARKAEHQRENAGVVLSAAAAGPTSGWSWEAGGR